MTTMDKETGIAVAGMVIAPLAGSLVLSELQGPMNFLGFYMFVVLMVLGAGGALLVTSLAGKLTKKAQALLG